MGRAESSLKGSLATEGRAGCAGRTPVGFRPQSAIDGFATHAGRHSRPYVPYNIWNLEFGICNARRPGRDAGSEAEDSRSMPRPDLLALSADDLAVLTNRGTVKRAQRELESGEVVGELDEAADGGVAARWSDGVECRLPAGKVLGEGRCTCAATTLCRHLVRTVLAYQRRTADQSLAGEAAGAPMGPPEPWDPGQIGDDVLAAAFRPAAITKARGEFQQGLLVELVRGAKPSARFHVPPHTVRFLVPGDIRYTYCDCAEPAPCRHVPLAVWAFRMLEPTAQAGLLSTQQVVLAVPTALLDDLEETLLEWIEQGTSAAPHAWVDRLARLESRFRSDDLVWPAEALDELARQFERYLAHDALFEPNRVAELIAELVIRSDAIRNDTRAIPQLVIRGTRADRPVEIGAARYVGLGCGARVRRRSVELMAYLQDVDTGTVVAVSREFADPPAGAPGAEPPRDFTRLAQTTVVKGASLAAVGAGQLLIQGAKRTPGHRLVIGRGRAVVNPQAFAWEQLRAPVLAEDFDELRARLGVLPPASLRPRRVGEDFHVVAIAGITEWGFDASAQVVRATLIDVRGNRAALEHPFHSRGRGGFEALLGRLAQGPPEALRFVAGPARLGPRGLVLSPTALVFQDASARQVLQPWIDRAAGVPGAPAPARGLVSQPADPIDDYPQQLATALGEVILLGLQRADGHAVRTWRELARFGTAIGFDRLTHPVAALADALDQKSHTPRWDMRPAARIVLEVTALARLASDVGH